MDEIPLSSIGRLVIDGSDVAVARVEGEIDLSNADAFFRHLRRTVASDAPGLVVDLSAASYVDSVGFRQLFALHRHLARRRQELRLVVPADSLLRGALAVMGVEEAIEVHEAVESALADWSDPAAG